MTETHAHLHMQYVDNITEDFGEAYVGYLEIFQNMKNNITVIQADWSSNSSKYQSLYSG